MRSACVYRHDPSTLGPRGAQEALWEAARQLFESLSPPVQDMLRGYDGTYHARRRLHEAAPALCAWSCESFPAGVTVHYTLEPEAHALIAIAQRRR